MSETYLGQDESPRIIRPPTPVVRVMGIEAAQCLFSQAAKKGEGGEVDFLATAVEAGWKIDFGNKGGLLPDHTNIVGDMWRYLDSPNPGVQGYGRLVAASLHIGLEGDGK